MNFSRIKLLACLCMLTLLAVSCSQKEIAPEGPPNVVAKVNDGHMEMEMSSAEVAMYFAADFESPNDITEWSVEPSGEFYYLIARGNLPGKNKTLSVAIELDRNGGYLTLDPAATQGVTTAQVAQKIKHKCTGDGCGCCQFLRNNGEIYGCKCTTSLPGCNNGGACSHSIETVSVVVGN